MSSIGKQPSNPFSTGGGGTFFESKVQACYAALMLTGGFAPALPGCSIKEILLQGSRRGYQTDDFVVVVENTDGATASPKQRKMLCQVKHSINISKGNSIFRKVIQSAWKDFNNAELFRRNSDAIALITGPLSKTDVSATREMLEWARSSRDFDEFADQVKKVRYSSKTKRAKLEAFQVQLQRANGGEPVSHDALFQFLQSFYLLGYDLDFKPGVTISLLTSVISPYSHQDPQGLWARIVQEVEYANTLGGHLDKEELQEKLGKCFQAPHTDEIPPELLARRSTGEASEEETATVAGYDWNRDPHASELVIASLVGSWNEGNQGDIDVICKLSKIDYGEWIPGIQEILQAPDSPIALRDRLWSVAKRSDLLKALAKRIFDPELSLVAAVSLTVFAERDPQFDLAPDKRFAASIYGKTLTHSPQLRKGLGETLAFLGSHPEALTSCSTGKAKGTARVVVRDTLSGTDWERWASLNDILPLLAEAAPSEFLDMVDKAFQSSPCPFDGVFAQEGRDSFTGRNYMTGLLWALEDLAWNRDYFSRVISILGELAQRDPGGTWANRPANSLITILLPWLPQTTAPLDQRKVAIAVLCEDQPQVAWRLLLAVLPKMHQVSMHSYHPVWQTEWIPADWQEGASAEQYWTAVSAYADMAAGMAKDNLQRLMELSVHLDSLSPQALDEVLLYLSSDSIKSLPEDQRTELWNRLMQFINDNRRARGSRRTVDSKMLSKVQTVAGEIAPASPFYRYQRLFTDGIFDLFDGRGSPEEQQKRLDEQQQKAIKRVYKANGYEGLLRFVHDVQSPSHVGSALGASADDTISAQLLPSSLDSDDPAIGQLLRSFILRKYFVLDWQWVDTLDTRSWTLGQKAQFLICLPFVSETWKRVAIWLKEDESEYWTKTPTSVGGKDDFAEAAEKLCQFGRPLAAARCLQHIAHQKKAIDGQQIIRTLKAAAVSSEKPNQDDGYAIAKLVEVLQQDSAVNRSDVATIEWILLPLLDGGFGVQHKALDRELAESPDFLCQVIRMVFRSNRDKDQQRDLNPQQQKLAENGYRLLREWRTPPGLHEDGSFRGGDLVSWLNDVKRRCMESGHLEVALDFVGQVLFYVPADPDGLWIDKSAAKVLNQNNKDAERLRSGFYSAEISSQGAHWVDPSGKDERDLAEGYRQKASALTMHGYARLAGTLQDVAEWHDRQAGEAVARYESQE